MKKVYLHSAVVALSLQLTACANVPQSVSVEQVNSNLDGLVLDDRQYPTLVYKREASIGLENYSKFIIDPVSVSYSDEEFEGFTPEQVNQLRTGFHATMSEALNEAGYEVVSEPQPGTMRLSLTLSDLKAPSTYANLIMLVVPGWGPKVGEVTIEATFEDADSGVVNAVVIENSRGPYLFNRTPWTSTGDIRLSFNDWAKSFVNSVDQAHGKILASK